MLFYTPSRFSSLAIFLPLYFYTGVKMAKILSYYRHASAYHNNDDRGKGLYKKNNSLIQRQILYHNRADGWVGLNSLFITWQSIDDISRFQF